MYKRVGIYLQLVVLAFCFVLFACGGSVPTGTPCTLFINPVFLVQLDDWQVLLGNEISRTNPCKMSVFMARAASEGNVLTVFWLFASYSSHFQHDLLRQWLSRSMCTLILVWVSTLGHFMNSDAVIYFLIVPLVFLYVHSFQYLLRRKGTPIHTNAIFWKSRGMQSTIYVEMASGVTTDDLYWHLSSRYEGEEFVILLQKGVVPHTQNVRGSNYCLMNVFEDRIPGRAIIISV
ncbi:hypothetical protein KI387_036822, partial [Taxus chinensis]